MTRLSTLFFPLVGSIFIGVPSFADAPAVIKITKSKMVADPSGGAGELLGGGVVPEDQFSIAAHPELLPPVQENAKAPDWWEQTGKAGLGQGEILLSVDPDGSGEYIAPLASRKAQDPELIVGVVGPANGSAFVDLGESAELLPPVNAMVSGGGNEQGVGTGLVNSDNKAFGVSATPPQPNLEREMNMSDVEAPIVYLVREGAGDTFGLIPVNSIMISLAALQAIGDFENGVPFVHSLLISRPEQLSAKAVIGAAASVGAYVVVRGVGPGKFVALLKGLGAGVKKAKAAMTSVIGGSAVLASEAALSAEDAVSMDPIHLFNPRLAVAIDQEISASQILASQATAAMLKVYGQVCLDGAANLDKIPETLDQLIPPIDNFCRTHFDTIE